MNILLLNRSDGMPSMSPSRLLSGSLLLSGINAATCLGLAAGLPVAIGVKHWAIPAHKSLWWLGVALALVVGRHGTAPHSSLRLVRAVDHKPPDPPATVRR